jgi:hypothetical protein
MNNINNLFTFVGFVLVVGCIGYTVHGELRRARRHQQMNGYGN